MSDADDLEARVEAMRQRLRLRDHLDALQAEEALDRLVSPPAPSDAPKPAPKDSRHPRKTGADSGQAHNPETPEDQAAAQLEASARRSLAAWAGDGRVTQLVDKLRPSVHSLVDKLGLDDEERLAAAARILGLGLVEPDGTELPNLFNFWPADRRQPAGLIAAGLRQAIAEIVASLRSDGVSSLPAIGQVTPDTDAPDGLDFASPHVALLLMLWLDIPLAGRSGAAIAADLPMLGIVGWERSRSVLLVGDASQPDILAGDTLRRAHARRSAQSEPQVPDDGTAGASTSKFGPDESEPPSRRIDRYRLPGWSDLAEIAYLAKHPGRPTRHAGRPRGPYLIQSRAEIEDPYRRLWIDQGHRPSWRAVAIELGVDDRTLRRARRKLGIDTRPISRKPE